MLKVLKENPILAIKADPPSNDHVQGTYTEDQVKALMATVKDTIPASIDVREKQVYVE